MRLIRFIILFLLVLGVTASAQEEKLIKKIEILKTSRTNPEMIKREMRSKEGEPLNREELVEDLHRIYKMGFFEDVKRQLIEENDGYVITIVVKERKYVVGVSFEGNLQIRDKVLQKTIKTQPGGFLFEYFIKKRDIELIKNLYVDESYFNVQVDSNVKETEGGVIVFYKIRENNRAKIHQVTFSGNEHVPDYEIKRVMETEFYGFFPDRVYRKKIFENDINNIKLYYRSEGYLESSIDYRVVFCPEDTIPPENKVFFNKDIIQKYKGEEIGIFIFVRISEGPRYKIGKVDIVGNKEEIISAATILEELKLKEGDFYSKRDIYMDAQSIIRLYGDKGYAFASVRPEEKFNFEEQKVNLSFIISEGNLFYIQDVEIIGNKRTKLQVILREIDIAKGEKFNYSKFAGARLNLTRLGLFNKVDVYKRKGSGADLVVVIIEVEEAQSGAFEVMLSYDEYNKFAGTVSLKQKNFDALGMFKGKFTGAAHEVTFQYFGSPVSEELSFFFKNPRLFDGKNSFSVRLADRERTYTEYSEDTKSSYYSIGRELLKNFNMSVGFSFSDIDIYDVGAGAPAQIQQEVGLSKVRAIHLNGSLNKMNYYIPFFQSGGFYLGGGVEYGGDFLGATREYVAVHGSARLYQTLFEKEDGARTVMKLSLSGKVANEMGDETAVPLSERSALGGIGSVRGFHWYSIGPYVGNDNVRGDAHLLFNAEVLFPLKWDPVRRRNLVHGVIFCDIGGVWEEAGQMFDDIEDIETARVRASVGVGLKLYPGGMPIPIEFYWSLPYAKDGDRTSRFQIGIFGMPF